MSRTPAEIIEDFFRTTSWYANPKLVADDFIAALHAAGYKVMPREPTEKMTEAAVDAPSFTFPNVYRAMWDAAP